MVQKDGQNTDRSPKYGLFILARTGLPPVTGVVGCPGFRCHPAPYPAWTDNAASLRTHEFIGDTYGVDARPYFRPPFGVHNARVDALAADLGYTVPTLWYGSLSDSGLISEQELLSFADTWFLPEHIVIGHLNFEPVTNVFGQLHTLLHNRGLTTVTLNDVFTSAAHP